MNAPDTEGTSRIPPPSFLCSFAILLARGPFSPSPCFIGGDHTVRALQASLMSADNAYLTPRLIGRPFTEVWTAAPPPVWQVWNR